jgi:hypothetical protein
MGKSLPLTHSKEHPHLGGRESAETMIWSLMTMRYPSRHLEAERGNTVAPEFSEERTKYIKRFEHHCQCPILPLRRRSL